MLSIRVSMLRLQKQPLFQALSQTSALSLMMFLLLAAWQIDNNVPFSDPDTGWHIKAGQWILQNGRLPTVDIWSYTAGDTQWFNLSWLFDIALAGLHALGGLPLIFILTVTLYGTVGAILVQKSLNKGAGFIAIVLIFGISVGPIIVQVSLCRPNIISAFLLLLCIYILEKDRAAPSWRLLLLLPAITALWVNIHGGFLILFILLGCHGIENLIHRDKQRFIRLSSTGVAVCAATLVNPYGYHIFEGTFRTLGSVMMEYINEWQSVNFKKDYHYTLFLILLLLGFRPLDKSIPIGDKIFALIVLVLTLGSIRHGLTLTIAVAPLLAVGLTHNLQESLVGNLITKKDAEYKRDIERPAVAKVTSVLCLILVFALVFPTTRSYIAPKSDQLLPKDTSPQRMLNYVAEHHAGYRWLSEYGIGGPLIYYGAPEFKVFIDGRADTVYPPELLKDYMIFLKGFGNGRKANNVVKKYKIDGLVFLNKSIITEYLNQNIQWKRVYRDKSYSVFVKRLKTD